MTFAGFPITIEYGGVLFRTTVPAPMIHPLPIVTPLNNVTLAHINASSSTIMSFLYLKVCFLWNHSINVL